MKWFIFDFETIGQDSKVVPAVDCSYLVADTDRFLTNPYTFRELVEKSRTTKLDVREQMNKYGCKYNKRDVDWWQQQDKKVRKKILPSEADVSVDEFIDEIVQYIRAHGKIDHWWSRSNTFDPIILTRLAEYVDRLEEISKLLPYWKVRDTRTYIDAKFNFTSENGFVPVSDHDFWNKAFAKHDSSHDIAADMLRLQTIARVENDLEPTER